VFVFCTAPPDIARLIVEERLAACVNILQVRSTFLWEKKVNELTEALLIIKTEKPKVEKLAARIREVHPYELPEIIALPITGGDEGYLKWISESVRVASASGKQNSEDV